MLMVLVTLLFDGRSPALGQVIILRKRGRTPKRSPVNQGRNRANAKRDSEIRTLIQELLGISLPRINKKIT
jgi:hypothetical protein